MNLGLKDRVALVAASSQGIGRATAEAFAAEGCRVAMCARNQQILQTAAEQTRKQYNGDVLAEAFDVTDAAAVSTFVAALSQQRIFCARSDPAHAEEALGPHHHSHSHATPTAISAKSQPARRMNPQPVPSNRREFGLG
jgi:NAD(P)-dependent dehydrogenase (short-subunit alcohol dehydrogenase family)